MKNNKGVFCSKKNLARLPVYSQQCFCLRWLLHLMTREMWKHALIGKAIKPAIKIFLGARLLFLQSDDFDPATTGFIERTTTSRRPLKGLHCKSLSVLRLDQLLQAGHRDQV